MAITLVGPAEDEDHDGAAFVMALPSMLDGDTAYIGIYSASASANARDVTTAGWGQIGSLSISGDEVLAVWRKRMGASPDASATIGAGTAGQGNGAVGFALRGVDDITPEDATPVNATVAGSSAPNPGAITTVTPGAMVLVFGGNFANDAAVTPPTGYSNGIEINSDGSSSNITVAAAMKEIASPGVENPAAWTGWNSSSFSAAITVAVRPAASGQPVTKRFGGIKHMAFTRRANGALWRGILRPALVPVRCSLLVPSHFRSAA